MRTPRRGRAGTPAPDEQTIEGRRPVLEALRAGRALRRILIAEGARDVREIVELARASGVLVEHVASGEVRSLARSRAPQGVIAIAPAFGYADLGDVLAQRPTLLLALDGVTDPQNVGALARSAEAAGAQGMLVPERRAAGVTPVVEKAAAGALAWLPVVRVGNLAAALGRVRDAGLWIVALDADGATPLWDLELATEPVCLVVGGEGAGVSRLVRDRSDVAVRIPLAGRVSSLNASVAGALALFEVARRRGVGKPAT